MQPVHLDLVKLPESNGNQTVIRLDGRLSLETVHNFIQTMRSEPAAQLILDMSGVSFLDSAGDGGLVQIFLHRRGQGRSIVPTGVTQEGGAVSQLTAVRMTAPLTASRARRRRMQP